MNRAVAGESGRPEEILIVKLAALGDVATTSVLLSRIRAERPTARVTWVVGRGPAPLVRLYDGVDEVIEVDEQRLLRGNFVQQGLTLIKLWARLIRRRYDRVILAHADSRYSLVVLPIGRGRTRKLDTSPRGRPNPVPGRFIGDEVARLLDGPDDTGPRPASYDMADLRARVLTVQLPATVRAEVGVEPLDVIVVAGGARNVLRDNPLRRWPVSGYAAVARALIAEGHRVALIGDAGDAWVRPAFDGIGVIDLIGKLDIPHILRVLADARVVITHDTGPLHLARLVRTPIVALFGPTAPRQMIGNPQNVAVLWGGADLACRPCYDGKNFPPCARNICLEEITADTVLSAARRALASSIVPASAIAEEPTIAE